MTTGAELIQQVHTTPTSMAEDVALPLRGFFFPLGFKLEILTNEPAILAAAAQSWPRCNPMDHSPTLRLRVTVLPGTSEACPPAPFARAQQHLLLFLADEHNYAVADLQSGFAFACITQSAVNQSLYLRFHFLEALALVLISAGHAPALHAACVSHQGHGILLCGPSGAGKSTLAYACARAGFTYIADDASYLLPKSSPPGVVGNCDQVRFRPHARNLFPELRERPLTPRLEGKPSIEVPTTELSLITRQEAEIHTLILLRRTTTGPARLVPISTATVLEHLQLELYPVEEIAHRQSLVLHQLAATPAYELHYSDLQDAIDCLKTLAPSRKL